DFGTDLAFCGVTASQEPDETNGGNWYTYTPAQDVTATFDLSGSTFNTNLFLYSSTCESLVCVDGDYSSGDDLTSLLEADLTGGETYYILVTGFGNNRGAYTLNVSCVDQACSPTIDNMVAVNQSGEPLDCVDNDGQYYL